MSNTQNSPSLFCRIPFSKETKLNLREMEQITASVSGAPLEILTCEEKQTSQQCNLFFSQQNVHPYTLLICKKFW